MANETTYSLITSLINPIWVATLQYIRQTFVMPARVLTFNDTRGMATRKAAEYLDPGTPTDNLAETQDLTTTEFDKALRATLSPKEIGKQYIITDRRVETDVDNVIPDAVSAIGYSIGRKVEGDLLSLLTSLAGGTIGTTSTALSLSKIWAARSLMASRAIPGPYTVVLHPYQYLDIQTELTTLTNAIDLTQQQQAFDNYFIPKIGDMDLVVSNLVPIVGTTSDVQTVTVNGTPTGGTFTLSFGGYTTSALAYNETAANVQAALRALPSIYLDSGTGAANVTVSGSAGGPFTVTFVAELKGRNLQVMTANYSALTGGTAPTVTIAHTTPGVANAVGGMFNRNALAFDVRRGLRIEPFRDPSLRSTELNATMIYAYGAWRPEFGIQLVSDATDPS